MPYNFFLTKVWQSKKNIAVRFRYYRELNSAPKTSAHYLVLTSFCDFSIFYASFIDVNTINHKGLTPLTPLLNRLDTVSNKPTLASFAAAAQREGVNGLFSISWGYSQMVSPDDRSAKVEIFHIEQGGLGLPNRDYYLKTESKLSEARREYINYLTTLLALTGCPNAKQRANGILAFETRIAKAHWSIADSRNAEKTYNKWSVPMFTSNAPGFPWVNYLSILGLAKQPGILVAQPGAFIAEAQICEATPLATLKDHMLIRLLDHYAPYLSDPFADAAFAFHGNSLQGMLKDKPGWQRATVLVSQLMRDDVGREYVRRNFTPGMEAAAKKLVYNIVAAWQERLRLVSWMAPVTRLAAQRKLKAMVSIVGHTSHWRDYHNLIIYRNDLIGNVRRSFESEYQHQLDKLNHPAERDDWAMSPMQADAFEDPVKNTIILPAAIFQPPFFDPAADPAINYGAIGSFIGHEISHSFDDQGRKYDQDGRLTDWWTAEDVRKYSERTAKLVRQYDAYKPLPDQHIDGELVLGETMADLGGLIVGHLAYQRSLARAKAPVTDGFTGDQRFYLGWAQIWRMKYREETLRQQLLSDPHPPGEQRADIVRNRPEWYKAFHVKNGDRLYISPDQRVDVW